MHSSLCRRRLKICYRNLLVAFFCVGGTVFAQSPAPLAVPTALPTITVTSPVGNDVGTSDAASAGEVSGEQLNALPLLRPGDALDTIPGLVVSQHSGDGKANQLFLRGFNLDHGTDFATTIQGVPVNMPTSAHGQGYTDLNYLIPELVDRIDYRKGPYFSPASDFSSAGSANIYYRSVLEQNIVNLTFGGYGYRRALFAGSTYLHPPLGPSVVQSGPVLLGALEVQRADGPWTVPEDLKKTNAVLRLSDGTQARGWSIDAAYYSANWTSTDQVPVWLIEKKKIDRFSGLDATDGGKSGRAILATEWHSQNASGYARANAFMQHYDLSLWSNFTYFANNPINGDQFHQFEKRNFLGGNVVRGWNHKLLGNDSTTEIGFQVRYDSIRLGLANTQERILLNTVTDDQVNQSLSSLYFQNTTTWAPWLRTVIGARADYINMTSTSFLQSQNAGSASAAVASPKVSLIFEPWQKTEFFLNAGGGIHSNDARGVIYRVDPNTGLPLTQVPALVQTFGKEIGMRTELISGLKSSVAIWSLSSGSELIYSADSGTTEPKDGSQRYGIEWNNELTVNKYLKITGDLALTRAYYTSSNANGASGNLIPNAPSTVGQITAVFGKYGPWSGAAQYRYIGSYPLAQDGSLAAPSTSLANLRLQYELSANAAVALDALNIFNRQYYDIAYQQDFRVSPGAPYISNGMTAHPGEPRQFRLTLMLKG